MSARLPQDQVDLLQRAADDLDETTDYANNSLWNCNGEIARILRWCANQESAGPVLHDSALAIARAVLGEDS